MQPNMHQLTFGNVWWFSFTLELANILYIIQSNPSIDHLSSVEIATMWLIDLVCITDAKNWPLNGIFIWQILILPILLLPLYFQYMLLLHRLSFSPLPFGYNQWAPYNKVLWTLPTPEKKHSESIHKAMSHCLVITNATFRRSKDWAINVAIRIKWIRTVLQLKLKCVVDLVFQHDRNLQGCW